VEGEETYSVTEAARILRVTDRAVRKWLAEGTLEGSQGEGGRWRIPQRAVHARLDERPPREARGSDLSAAEMVEVVRDLERLLGRAEARAELRAELTERAESTLREERDRLLRERDAAQDEAKTLRKELQAERSKGFWRRLLGR
jgi:excisionase family DNA binding protein